MTEERKVEQPTAMNAFDLISMSKGLNLGNLFDVEQVRSFSPVFRLLFGENREEKKSTFCLLTVR